MSQRPLIFIIPIPNLLSSVSGGQSYTASAAHCSFPVIPSQSADWRGNPFPAPAGTALPPYTPPNAPRERPLPLPLGEVAERSEDGEGKQKRTASGRFFSVSINPLYAASSSFTQGELEGAKPASNQIKCRAKPCLARRAWSTPRVLASRREATIFVPQGGTKITTLFQAVERAEGFSTV